MGWNKHCDKRAALNTANTSDTASAKDTLAEELKQDAGALVRKAVMIFANTIYGSARG
jgi:hypothetical protein